MNLSQIEIVLKNRIERYNDILKAQKELIKDLKQFIRECQDE